jgi:hypothetical protein
LVGQAQHEALRGEEFAGHWAGGVVLQELGAVEQQAMADRDGAL